MRSHIVLFILGSMLACTGTAQQKESLLIGPGDLIQIKVFDTPELDQSVRVTDAGTISLIIGGDVRVSALTPDEAARSIEKTLKDGEYMRHPGVAVTIQEFATQKVSVLGEVRSPGAYTIDTSRSVLEVLTLAGGLTESADRKVLIERRGTKERVPYFVSNQADVALGTAVEVKPGDSVIVPRAGIVYVLGDVARPGGYTMTSNDSRISVLQLVARAGGTNHSAVPSHAKLIRKTASGYVEHALPLSAMQKGRQADMALNADDIVWVPFSYMRSFGMQANGMMASLGSAAVYKF